MYMYYVCAYVCQCVCEHAYVSVRSSIHVCACMPMCSCVYILLCVCCVSEKHSLD